MLRGEVAGAELRPDGLDISDDLIAQYKRQMGNAGAIVVAGPMGKFEEMGAQKGTRGCLPRWLILKHIRLPGAERRKMR